MTTAKVPLYLGLLEIDVRLKQFCFSNANCSGGGGGGQCSSQRSSMKFPVHWGNPEDDRQTIDTCIPIVHALFSQ